MALVAYIKPCEKNAAGNLSKVYITEIDNITSVTGVTTVGTDITAVTMVSEKKFHLYQAEIDSVQFKCEGMAGSNYLLTQTLTMKFKKRSAGLLTAIENLVTAIPCGLAVIRCDANGQAWLSGYDAVAVDKKARPYNKIKVTFDSGLKPGDTEMNAVTVELTRESEWDEVPFNATLSGGIATGNETTCTFISAT